MANDNTPWGGEAELKTAIARLYEARERHNDAWRKAYEAELQEGRLVKILPPQGQPIVNRRQRRAAIAQARRG